MEKEVQTKISELLKTVSTLFCQDNVEPDFGTNVGLPDMTEIARKTKITTKYLIRSGRVEDCDQIALLMKELAQSEKYGDRVEVTADDLRNDGFGDCPVFQSIVLEDAEADEASAVLGYALYFMGFCSWKGRLLYLEDVYIKSDYRGTGLGLALLNTIAKISERRGCKAIQGTVVEWNKDVMRLYKRIGARDMTECEKYHLVAIGRADVKKFANAKLPVLHNGSQIVTCLV